MTQEHKELLIIDISGRTPYGLKCKVDNTIPPCPSADDYRNGVVSDIIEVTGIETDKGYECVFDKDGDCVLEKVIPYLRPMSSMTDEEEDEYEIIIRSSLTTHIDWLNKNMFDYRGLIPKSLAIEAPEGMYNN